jgi:hypothetical protein
MADNFDAISSHTHSGIDSQIIQLKDISFDTSLWDKYSYWSTFFESIDGYSKQGNAPTISEIGVTLATAASLNSTSTLLKDPQVNLIPNFNKVSRFRLGIEFGASSLSNVQATFSLGTYGVGEVYYGFEVSGSTLKGSSSNQNTGSSNAITLKTLSVSTNYELEARFTPNRSIQFFVGGNLVGILRNELPVDTNSRLLEFYIKTTNSTAKSVIVSYYEVFQTR